MVQAGVILAVFFAGLGLGVLLAGLVVARDVQAVRAERRRLLAIQEQMLDDAAAMARQGSVVDALSKLPLAAVGFWVGGTVVNEDGHEVAH